MKTFLKKHAIAIVSAIALVVAILILFFVPDARMLGSKEFVLGGLFSIAIWESPSLLKIVWQGLQWCYAKIIK